MSHILKEASNRDNNCLFVVHRRELITQSLDTLKKNNIHPGVIANGFKPDYDNLIQIASVLTLLNRLNIVNKPKLVIWDETQHVIANSWQRVFDHYSDAYHIGLTATPLRLDGMGLGKCFDTIIEGPTVKWLIENNYLADYKIFAPYIPDLSKVKNRLGDYIKQDLVSAIDKPTITGSAIREYQKHCNGKRAIVFCINVEHSKHVTEQFKKSGIPAKHLDAKNNNSTRDSVLQEFKDNKIKVLSNVDLFSEGFDVPGIEAVILLRPTQSLGLYMQQVGRSLRKADGKTHAIILDHSGNCQRHGLPCAERQWSLSGKMKKEKSTSIKECPKCYMVVEPHTSVCPNCGHLWTKEEIERQIETIEADLVEVDKKKFKPKYTKTQRKQLWREEFKCNSFEELQQLGLSRGYKPGWAYYRWKLIKERKSK